MAPQEDDGYHNVNNILKPEDIKKHDSHTAGGAAAGTAGGAAGGGLLAALLSSVHPTSSSAQLAGEVPKDTEKPTPTVEEHSSAAPSGTFPEPPSQGFSDDFPPLERKNSLPGAFPETPFKEPESFSVNPIPASSGASNPVSIPAGEKLPDHQDITGNTVGSTATTSQEDYEKDVSSALPEEKSTGNTTDPTVTTSQEGYEKDVSSPLPEERPTSTIDAPNATTQQGEDSGPALLGEKSSLNTDDAHVTTKQEEDDKIAGSASPEEGSYGVTPIPASSGTSNPVSVPAGDKLPKQEGATGANVGSHVTTSKDDYEKDASSALPTEKSFGVTPIPASSGTGNPVSVPAGEELPVPEDITNSNVDSNVTTSKEDYEKDASSAVPVEKSYGVDPIPASAGIGNPVSVPAGDSVEQHKTLLPGGLYANATTSKEDYERAGSTPMPVGAPVTNAAEPEESAFVPDQTKGTDPESSLPISAEAKDTTDIGPFIQSSGPGTTTAALAGQVPLETRSKATVIEDEPPSATVTGPAPDVPEVVKESLIQAHGSPEAAASPEAVEEKKELEKELLQEVKTTDAAGEPAPTAAAATSAFAPLPTAIDSRALEPAKDADKEPEKPAEDNPARSRDISPMGKDPNDTAPAPSSPVVTTGVGESNTSTVSTPQKADAPASSAASSPATSTSAKDKKKKRTSFFGRWKEKLKG